MSQGGSEEPGFFARSISVKAFLALVGALIVVMAVVVVVVVLVQRADPGRDATAAGADSLASAVTSPHDLVEMPDGVSLSAVQDAAFVSLYLPDESGGLRSYGVSCRLAVAQTLADAVAGATELETEEAASMLGPLASESTITFVLPSRETVTFALYLEKGLIARGEKAWRPAGDLTALVDSAIKSPQ